MGLSRQRIGILIRETDGHERGIGDVWPFVALDADTKLVPSYLAGERATPDAVAFVADLASR